MALIVLLNQNRNIKGINTLPVNIEIKLIYFCIIFRHLDKAINKLLSTILY